MKLISMTLKDYRNIHDWIRRRMNHIKECSFCGETSKLDNALITGKEHCKDVDNYIKLCRKCHYKYDHPNGIKHSELSKDKISKSSKERIKYNGVSDKFKYSRLGSKISKEHKDIISKAMSGENHHNSKLTKYDVIEIRKSNLKGNELANIYNVSYRTIRNILNRKTWKNLD